MRIRLGWHLALKLSRPRFCGTTIFSANHSRQICSPCPLFGEEVSPAPTDFQMRYRSCFFFRVFSFLFRLPFPRWPLSDTRFAAPGRTFRIHNDGGARCGCQCQDSRRLLHEYRPISQGWPCNSGPSGGAERDSRQNRIGHARPCLCRPGALPLSISTTSGHKAL